MKAVCWMLVSGMLLGAQANAAPCTARSGPHTAALVELYTSQGCSSCPPADHWLASLEPGAVVPLALHVDYWDRLGWNDPYAQHAFAVRQRRLADLAGATFVYTPQVLLQGRDFRGWDGPAFEAQVKRIEARPPGAALALSLRPADGHTAELEVHAELLPPVRPAEPALYVATYQSGLVSAVSAGENRGRTLRNDYVVRDWLGPLGFGSAAQLTERRVLTVPPGAVGGRWGVAAFVQDRRDARVLQALILPACTP